jgi:hypothetical protein
MNFLSWLLGKSSEKINPTKSLNKFDSTNFNQIDSNKVEHLSFYVDGLQRNFKDYSSVGESLNLWVPKEEGVKILDTVYIYHKNGPGGCLGIVPPEHRDIIFLHLLKSLDYECKIEELSDNMCKVKCRLISKEETLNKIKQKKETLKNELTKPYNPKKSITTEIVLKRKNIVKVGEKLKIIFDDLDLYIQNYNWNIRFCNQYGDFVGSLEYNRTTIQKILKSHFNSFLFDIEVVNIEENKDKHLKGYMTRVVITPYQNNDTISNNN